MSRRGATADWPLEVGGRTSELGLEAAARTVADSSRGPIADRETHRRQPALVVVEVVALLVVHLETQTVVVPRVARPETVQNNQLINTENCSQSSYAQMDGTDDGGLR